MVEPHPSFSGMFFLIGWKMVQEVPTLCVLLEFIMGESAE